MESASHTFLNVDKLEGELKSLRVVAVEGMCGRRRASRPALLMLEHQHRDHRRRNRPGYGDRTDYPVAFPILLILHPHLARRTTSTQTPHL
jgi:hypothetical protein